MASFYGTDLDNSQTAGFDNYYGGDGNDFLLGTAGINAVYGGQGNDVVGGANFTSFTGLGTLVSPYVLVLGAASGNDFLDGDAGADIAYGGDGDDTINGGDGDDFGNITSYSGQVFVGGLFGGDGNDFIDGGAGNDLLDGGAGNDSLSGGDGNDQLRGGAGTDLLKGGGGNDVYNVEDALDVIVEGADEGTDFGVRHRQLHARSECGDRVPDVGRRWIELNRLEHGKYHHRRYRRQFPLGSRGRG